MDTDRTNLSDLQSLLEANTTHNGIPSLLNTEAIIEAMMPIMIIVTVVSIIISLLYIISIIQRIRVDRAILEACDILKEMNERDKTRSGSITSGVPASVAEE